MWSLFLLRIEILATSTEVQEENISWIFATLFFPDLLSFSYRPMWSPEISTPHPFYYLFSCNAYVLKSFWIIIKIRFFKWLSIRLRGYMVKSFHPIDPIRRGVVVLFTNKLTYICLANREVGKTLFKKSV